MLCACFLKENMSAFCVETQDRALVFAALKDDCLAWVEKLCHSTFQVGPLASPIHGNHMTHRASRQHILNSLWLSLFSKVFSRVLVNAVWRKTRFMPLQMKVKRSLHFTFYICPSNNMHTNLIQIQMCAQILLKH